MKNLYYYDTVFGKIGIAEQDNMITNLYFENDKIKDEFIFNETDLIKKAHKELVEYFNKEREIFDFKIKITGTEFEKQIYSELLKIPYGEVTTYKDIAIKIGKEKACQAVGNAIRKNPVPIFIPCHRVIGSNGKFIGYRGGIEFKKYLLILEKLDKNKISDK